MKRPTLKVGSRVRYIGGQESYDNCLLLMLIGRTGTIRDTAQSAGMDWFVEMDYGCFDIEAHSSVLIPIDDDESDAHDNLAFKRSEGTRHASDLLADCKAAMGKAFEGYKGGRYVMGELTPAWLANYGCCGAKLIALRAGGDIDVDFDG